MSERTPKERFRQKTLSQALYELDDAKEEITRLRAENAELLEALTDLIETGFNVALTPSRQRGIDVLDKIRARAAKEGT